ncbi:MAG: TRAP transporter small permease subunit [Gammaproteobacteria bacterium]|nr:MAG: TRAP transporter small permease subunit [Gammaproteobacteria bacterium]
MARGIDCFTEKTGQLIAWLTLIMMVFTCVIVVMRYFLETGSIALQESVTYLHSLLFLLGAAYTLKRGGHVRVDILYQRFSARTQALVDALGTLLFLIPVSLLILIFCWDYVASSWAIGEVSKEARGLPWVYLLKTLLLIMPVTLLLQGIAEFIKNLLFFCGIGGDHTGTQHEGMI